METKLKAIFRDYEDFEPTTEWAREEGCDYVLLDLQGPILVPLLHHLII